MGWASHCLLAPLHADLPLLSTALSACLFELSSPPQLRSPRARPFVSGKVCASRRNRSRVPLSFLSRDATIRAARRYLHALSRRLVKVSKFLPHHTNTLHDIPTILPLPLLLGYSFCFSNFFVTPSALHPSRASLTCRPGFLGGMCSFPPPSLLHGVLDLQDSQGLLSLSHSFRTTPFTSNSGAPPGLPR